MSIKFLVLGGGYFGFGGGGSADSIFMGAGIFLIFLSEYRGQGLMPCGGGAEEPVRCKKKHAKKFSRKNFWGGGGGPPPRNSLC